MTTQYCKEEVLALLLNIEEFKARVLRNTEAYLRTINVPNIGTLYNFDYDLTKEEYTVNHVFEYEGDVKQNFYIIPLSVLWTEY